MTDHVVRHRGADHRHLEHVLARLVVALVDGFGNFVRLAETHAHVTGLVAHHHQRAEAEAATALHDLRDAVDVDDALLSSSSSILSIAMKSSELETGFARGFGEALMRPWYR